MTSPRNPFRMGFEAARANFVPALIVQGTMLALVAGYYLHPATAEALGKLAAIKAASGYAFSFVSAMLAGAILPELLTIGVFQKGRVTADNLRNLAFTVPYWGCDGLLVDAFYRVQSAVFGDAGDVRTVTLKVLVDQFIATPFLFVPLALAAYEWQRRGYVLAGLSEMFRWPSYKERAVPTLVTNWCMWIPALVGVYALPPLLQIPLFTLALTIWVLLFTYLSRRRAEREVAPAAAVIAST